MTKAVVYTGAGLRSGLRLGLSARAAQDGGDGGTDGSGKGRRHHLHMNSMAVKGVLYA